MRRHRYSATVTWTGNRGAGTSDYRSYGRQHEITAPSKPPIPGSADPVFRGDAARWSPEELFLASIAACHKLWYLHLCADAGIVVTDYVDEVVGEMIEDADGGGGFTLVTLRPRVTITGGDPAVAHALHKAAHEKCFIANSVAVPIACEPVVSYLPLSAPRAKRGRA